MDFKKTQIPEKASIINHDYLDYSYEVLKAITHPLRLSLIKFIDREKSTYVNKIYKSLDLEQSITSQHLRVLRNADLVTTKRDGKYILYSLNYERMQTILSILKRYM